MLEIGGGGTDDGACVTEHAHARGSGGMLPQKNV